MRVHRLLLRGAVTLFFAFLLLSPVLAGGQQNGSGSAESNPAPASAQAADGSGFPVTITHKYGSTTIPAKPVRVVSVGFSEQDTLLALGVIPVGIRDWYGEQPNAVWPWARAALADSSPVVLSAAELDIEEIAALAPDLIVGVSSGMSEREYELLSGIAPTVTQSSDYVDYGTPWPVETRILGQATGTSEKAEQIIAEIEGRFAQIRADHPEFEDKTAAVSFVYLNTPGAYASQDSRSRLLTQMGFVIPPEYDEIAGDQFWLSFSAERLDLLNTDVVVWIASSEEGIQDVKNLTLRESFQPASEGREIFLGNIPSGAFSFASPLSIPYLLDLLVPALAAAVDGDPASLVPEGLR